MRAAWQQLCRLLREWRMRHAEMGDLMMQIEAQWLNAHTENFTTRNVGNDRTRRDR